MSKNQRQKNYVDRKVQRALVLRFLGHWLLFVLSSLILLTVWQVLVSGDPLQGFWRELSEVITRNLAVFVTLALLLPVFVYDTIKLSNRFAGPIVRLRDALGDLADGKQVQPLSVRNRDFWQDLIDNFNRTLSEDDHSVTVNADRDVVDHEDEFSSAGRV